MCYVIGDSSGIRIELWLVYLLHRQSVVLVQTVGVAVKTLLRDSSYRHQRHIDACCAQQR